LDRPPCAEVGDSLGRPQRKVKDSVRYACRNPA
jgi:hypothetical protein